MKKFLKNISLFIIAIAFTFGFSLNVFADACEGQDPRYCRVGAVNGKIISSGNDFSKIWSSTPLSRVNFSYSMYHNGRGYVDYFSDSDLSAIYDYRESYGAWNSYYGSGHRNDYIMFCLDGQLEGSSSLRASRFLMNSDDGKDVQAYDAAVLSILTSDNLNPPTAAENIAKLIALRGMGYTFGFFKDVYSGYHSVYYATLSTIHGWLSWDDVKNAYNDLNSELSKYSVHLDSSVVRDVPGYGFRWKDNSTISKAYGYYLNGLRAATEYLKNGSASGSVEIGDKKPTEVVSDEDAEGNLKVSKDVVHTIKLKGSSENTKFMINSNGNNGIKYADGTQYNGLTSYISKIEFGGKTVEGKDNVAAVLDKDLVALGYITSGDEIEIKITAHFEGYKVHKDVDNINFETLECGQQPIKYAITGTYDDGTAGMFGDYVATVWYAGSVNNQRYIGIERNGGDGNPSSNKNWSSDYETSLIDKCDCIELIDACVKSGNINSKACEVLRRSNCGECAYIKAACDIDSTSPECDEEKYVTLCESACDTSFTAFECCDEKNELIVSTADDHEVNILGPGKDNPDSSSVKACFVSKMDAAAKENGDEAYANNAGIEVKDQKENSYALTSMKDNHYCSVSCKEDYVMTMPTAKLVNAGRYFTFKAKVEGTKLCYTNTIDREKYNHDIVEAQVAMVNAYTEYLKWKALSEATIQSGSCACSASGSCSCPVGQSCPCSASCSSAPCTKYYVTAQYTNHFVIDQNKNYKNGTISINASAATATYGEDGHVDASCSDGCCYANCTDGTSGSAETLKSNIQTNLTAAISALNARGEEYRAILKEYDDCSNGWTSKINYDADVYYDYNETYMNLLNNHIGEMDEEKSYTGTTDWYCNSDIAEGSGKENTKGEIKDKNYTECSVASNTYSETSINYYFCNTSGCKVTPEKVSDARYKKISSGVTANYRPKTLFYNVYPSGEITTDKDADGAVALDHSLPVSLKTERGIYKYTVNIGNLGELKYDENTLGRYVGTGNTAIMKDAMKGDVLPYNCSYLVNIQTQTGWVCDFDKDKDCTDDCISNCIGPNCDNDHCEGVDCVADCIGAGCIYDSGAGTSLIQKTVTLNNLFPEGTDSYNWNASKNIKASSTISAIEGKGNNVYNETPVLSITIDPSTAREIRNYNKSVIDNGGYSNKTVACENIGAYAELACYSSFITDILDGKYGNKVVNSNSLIADDKYRSNEGNDKYFELWDKLETISENNMIGPSWK